MPVAHWLVKACEHIIPKTATFYFLTITPYYTSYVYICIYYVYIYTFFRIYFVHHLYWWHETPWKSMKIPKSWQLASWFFRGRWAQSWNNFATAVPCFCHWGWERQVGPESCFENPDCHVWCHFYKGRLVNCWYCTSLRPQLIPLYICICARDTDLNLHRFLKRN